jgi:hypothetical protein
MSLTNPNSLPDNDDQRDRLVIEVTPEMIEAGSIALHDEIGFDHNGDSRRAALAVLRAMAALAGVSVRESGEVDA